MEGVEDLRARKNLAHFVTTIVEEALRKERTSHVPEVHQAVPIIGLPPVVVPTYMTQISKEETSAYHPKKRLANDVPTLSRPAAYHQDDLPLGNELIRPPLAKRIARQMPFLEDILRKDLPRHFRSPHVPKYNDSSYLEDHLCRFENDVVLHR